SSEGRASEPATPSIATVYGESGWSPAIRTTWRGPVVASSSSPTRVTTRSASAVVNVITASSHPTLNSSAFTGDATRHLPATRARAAGRVGTAARGRAAGPRVAIRAVHHGPTRATRRSDLRADRPTPGGLPPRPRPRRPLPRSLRDRSRAGRAV